MTSAAEANLWRTEWLHRWEVPFLFSDSRFQCAHGVLQERPREHEKCGHGVLDHQLLMQTLDAGRMLLNQPFGQLPEVMRRSRSYAEKHGLKFIPVGQAGAVCVGLFVLPDADVSYSRKTLSEAYRDAFKRPRI